MRPLTAPLALLAALPLLGLAALQDDDLPKPTGLAGHLQAEAERIEAELEGPWALLEYRDPTTTVERHQYAGYATFQDGVMTLLLRLDIPSRRLLGTREVTIVHAGAYHYRIVGGNRLQTATMMGFSNDNDDLELAAEPPTFPREYEVTVRDGELRMRRWDALELVFRKIGGGAFPERAADALERGRGRPFVTPEEWVRERRGNRR